MQVSTGEKETEMVGVAEYDEHYGVVLAREEKTGRLVIRAKNEGGCNQTEVDLLQVLAWIKANHPELLIEGGV